MPVKSSGGQIFIYKKGRFSSLLAAETAMKAEDDLHSRLQALDPTVLDTINATRSYGIAIEPFVDGGENVTLVCGIETELDASITGVDQSLLEITWEQLSGNTSTIQSPNTEDTLITNQTSDTSDKIFGIKVLNTETGITNSNVVTVFATPTDFQFNEATGYKVFKLNNDNRSFIDISATYNGLISTSDNVDINPSKSILWTKPEDRLSLYKIELLENTIGTYDAISSTFNNEDERLDILVNQNTPTAYKVNFIYKFGGILESILSKNNIRVDDNKMTLVEEKSLTLSITGKAKYFYSSIQSRATIETKNAIDNFKTFITNTSDLGITMDLRRAVKIIKETDEINLNPIIGLKISYESDLLRSDGTIIGGG